jgi:proteasome alpha subunit
MTSHDTEFVVYRRRSGPLEESPMKRNDQQAYDRGTSLFSPDGRIYQVEYAREAVGRGAPSVGIRGKNAVVLAAHTRTGSDLMETESVEKLHKLDDHVGAASAGHVADARRLIDLARRQTQQNRLQYGEPIGVEALTKTLTDFVQESTQVGGVRPFGAALLVGGVDEHGPQLFETDPSGTPNEWRAVAIGSGRKDIQAHLEESYDLELSVDDAVELALLALRESVDEVTPETVTLAVIDEDGYRKFSEADVAAVLEDIDDGA